MNGNINFKPYGFTLWQMIDFNKKIIVALFSILIMIISLSIGGLYDSYNSMIVASKTFQKNEARPILKQSEIDRIWLEKIINNINIKYKENSIIIILATLKIENICWKNLQFTNDGFTLEGKAKSMLEWQKYSKRIHQALEEVEINETERIDKINNEVLFTVRGYYKNKSNEIKDE